MTSLYALPATLITDIFREVLETDDHLPHLLVCKYLHGIVEDLVYRDIDLDYLDAPDPCRRLHLFLRTLVDRPDLGRRVRHLSIESGYDFQGLPEDDKELERDLVQSLGFGARWQRSLNLEHPSVYAALIVILTPNVLSLKLQIRLQGMRTAEVLNPNFYRMISRRGGLGNLESLTYGPGPPAGRSREFCGMVYPGNLSKVFYLPSLTDLHLTGLGRGDFLRPVDDPPSSKLKHIWINGECFCAEQLWGMLCICPKLTTLTILLDDRGNSKYTVYGHVRQALELVQSTLQELVLGFYRVEESFDAEPVIPQSGAGEATGHPQIESIGSFAGFSELRKLTLPVVGYLGGCPDKAPELDASLPPGLRSLQIHDDTWIVDCDSVELYWERLLHQLYTLVRRKASVVPDLKELTVCLHGSIKDFDFNGQFRPLRKLGKEVGVEILLWRSQYEREISNL